MLYGNNYISDINGECYFVVKELFDGDMALIEQYPEQVGYDNS